MEPQNAAQQILPKSSRRLSFSPIRSPIKALRSLSIGSQLSIAQNVDTIRPDLEKRRSTLCKSQPSDNIKELARHPSKSSSEAYTENMSTRPTTPGTGSQGTSIAEDYVGVIKAGPLQPDAPILKSKKGYLVLTPVALMKFKNKSVASEQFPQLSIPRSATEALSSTTESIGSVKDLGIGADVIVPLDKIVAVHKDEGIKPSFGIEVWWRDPMVEPSFGMFEVYFGLPEDRDDWLKQTQAALRQRTRALAEERIPTRVESDLNLIHEIRNPQQKGTRLDIFPMIPRRPYTRQRYSSVGARKGWRDGSAFYLAFSKNTCMVAQFTTSPSGQRVNPNIVQFGLVTLSKVNGSLNDQRFDLLFRLPLDKPKKLELSSKHHRSIISRLFKADTFLKPAWPLWTRREVFFIDGESQQIHLPAGEDYGGFKRTLEAFLQGYNCACVNWKVNWKGVKYPPEFRLLPPTTAKYTAHQFLAVFRALRFNDYFKSLSFRDVDFSPLAGKYDNSERLEPTAWLSRTGKRSLTRDEFEFVEKSSVLFQEIASLMLGSESVKHLDLGGVLSTVSAHTTPSGGSSLGHQGCEIVPPIVLLLRSLQSRCRSIVLSRNTLSTKDVSSVSRTLQNLPGTMKCLGFSRCRLDEAALVSLWAGIHEQRSNLEVLELGDNAGLLDAATVAQTLRQATKLRRLDLSHALKGILDGPLFRPWTNSPYIDAWRLEEINLSGWKVNFDTISGLLRYMELDESKCLHQLVLNNCGISGEVATAIFCRLGMGRDMHLHLNGNHLEEGSIDWIDLIHGNEAPRMLHLDMIQFKHESSFNQLLTALTYNTTIEFLSMVGTGPPASASSKTSQLLSKFFENNSTLQFLDLSGYSGKLEESHIGWGLAGALGGLKRNHSLRQLRIRNQDIGTAKDVTELCRVIAGNQELAMFDIQNNNFNHHQFAKLVHALEFNHRLISFPISQADRDYALDDERRIFRKNSKHSKGSLSKAEEVRVNGLLEWLRGHWESEANKATDFLTRNKDDPANRPLELDAECLEAWEDDSLPSWIVAKPSARDMMRETDSLYSRDSRAETLRPNSVSSVPAGPTTGPVNAGARRTYGGAEAAVMQTSIIEEEGTMTMSAYSVSHVDRTPVDGGEFDRRGEDGVVGRVSEDDG